MLSGGCVLCPVLFLSVTVDLFLVFILQTLMVPGEVIIKLVKLSLTC